MFFRLVHELENVEVTESAFRKKAIHRILFIREDVEHFVQPHKYGQLHSNLAETQ